MDKIERIQVELKRNRERYLKATSSYERRIIDDSTKKTNKGIRENKG